jgi:phosphomevalonate kinase
MMEGRFRSQDRSYENCRVESGTGAGFSASTAVLTVIITSHLLTHIHLSSGLFSLDTDIVALYIVKN